MNELKKISRNIKVDKVISHNGEKGLDIYIRNYSSDKFTKFYVSSLEFAQMYQYLHSKR